jgi:hypothetical protein
MQLDRTHIAIRERPLPVIMDLALRVIAGHFGPLMLGWAAGVLPMVAINVWLLGKLPSVEEPDAFFAYLFFLTLLVTWQMPLATAGVTLYLGQALFQERPQVGRMLGDLGRAAPQLVLYQVLLRALIVPWLISWLFLFVSRAYLNEIILLERTPLRAHGNGPINTSRRAWALHSGMWGDLLARWVFTGLYGLILGISLLLSLSWLGQHLLSDSPDNSLAGTLLVHLVPWLVIGYVSVVRFLCYLDLRIRREGWEVELLMRAEAARRAKSWT